MSVVLSIIVPTYNERANLEELLKRIDSALRVYGVSYEVIIVDDNSPDGTAEYAEKLSELYPVKVLKRLGKLGLSSAVLDGLKIAEGEFVAVMGADLQYPPEVLPKMLEKLQNCDVIIASRYVEGGSMSEWSFLRRLISKGATLITRVLLPKVRTVKDPMSGFFIFRRDVVEGVSMNPRGFKILLEILVRGNVRKICEVPYTFGVRFKGESKLDTSEIVNYMVHVLNLSPEYVRFALVGASGVVVNLGVLTLLRYFNFPHVFASAVGIEASVVNNFILNDLWTFRGRGKDWWRKFLKFHTSSAVPC